MRKGTRKKETVLVRADRLAFLTEILDAVNAHNDGDPPKQIDTIYTALRDVTGIDPDEFGRQMWDADAAEYIDALSAFIRPNAQTLEGLVLDLSEFFDGVFPSWPSLWKLVRHVADGSLTPAHLERSRDPVPDSEDFEMLRTTERSPAVKKTMRRMFGPDES